MARAPKEKDNPMTTKTKPIERDNYGKPRTDYYDKLAGMTDAELYEETKSKIWLSGYANNNPRSDYHWHVDAIYDEWSKRGKVEQYGKAHKEVVASL